MTSILAVLICLWLAPAAAQAPPDFSGTWTLDAEKTLQPGPDGRIVLAPMLGERVVVQQTPTSITLRITVRGDVVVAVYDLTGAESRNVSPGDIPVVSRASWKDDRLVIDSTSDSVEKGKPITIRTTRVLWIDKAGDLIVERTGTPASAVTPSRSVYRLVMNGKKA
jgi:hypothetical protein